MWLTITIVFIQSGQLSSLFIFQFPGYVIISVGNSLCYASLHVSNFGFAISAPYNKPLALECVYILPYYLCLY